ncbi:MAG: sulfotransferase family 2 domain-containing protein, partial [Anaerolineales bacterium]|nr:sulfotransferase family 2 domain-containing protein [Anaerolineales bacterium]
MPQFVNNPPASLIIFLHILKTAGSTFNNLLDDYYTVQNSAATSPTRLHPNGSVENLTSLSREQRQKIELLYGHMGFGLHQHFSRPAHYITILREPVSRVISQYRHEKRVPLSNTYTLLQKGMDLKGFVDYYNDFQTDNMQTRMLAGNWQGRGYGACTPEMFA